MSKLKKLLSEKEWLVEESGFDKLRLNANETRFTIGNGYLGTRGSLEEGHSAGLRGTYLNGVFDHHQSFVADLVNAPDWTVLKLRIDGNLLSLETTQILSHYRALDMKNGFLYRETKYKDSKGRITNYESLRYANLSRLHTMEMKLSITPENYSGLLSVESAIDANTFNLDVEPAFKEKQSFDSDIKWNKWARSIHTDHVDTCSEANGIYLEVKTKERDHTIGYSSSIRLLSDEYQKVLKLDFKYAAEELFITAKQGESIDLVKTVGIYTSRDVSATDVKKSCLDVLGDSVGTGLNENLKEHIEEWDRKWEDCQVEINGDAQANHAMKFNIYHLLITANPRDPYANIGAKSLSGEGYKGHVFWDTEIFMLPFYTFTQPDTAKALMLYRYHTKEGARDYAKEGSYEGIRYPWESADTGHEVTPPWTSDGKVRIWTAEREQHITAAVGFGLNYYHAVSGDDKFLAEYGAEIFFETARFWASRLEYNEAELRYELTEVEGPDEFHELVNNSVYTNALTKWNLEQSVLIYGWLAKCYPEKFRLLIEQIDLSDIEVKRWAELAENIYIPFDEKKQLVEQFEGYFDLEDVPITEWTKSLMPKYPAGYDHDSCQQTMLLKQPDVLMLMYVLPDMFNAHVKKANYEFYEPKTMHKSSLSPSIHAIMGVETDHFEKALQYFKRSLYVDLEDNQGNTMDGIHIASCGGSWQALVCGFGGLRVKKGRMTFKPWLPPDWTSISFGLKWKGDSIKVVLHRDRIEFHLRKSLSMKKQPITIDVVGKEVSLYPDELIKVDF